MNLLVLLITWEHKFNIQKSLKILTSQHTRISNDYSYYLSILFICLTPSIIMMNMTSWCTVSSHNFLTREAYFCFMVIYFRTTHTNLWHILKRWLWITWIYLYLKRCHFFLVFYYVTNVFIPWIMPSIRTSPYGYFSVTSFHFSLFSQVECTLLGKSSVSKGNGFHVNSKNTKWVQSSFRL